MSTVTQQNNSTNQVASSLNDVKNVAAEEAGRLTERVKATAMAVKEGPQTFTTTALQSAIDTVRAVVKLNKSLIALGFSAVRMTFMFWTGVAVASVEIGVGMAAISIEMVQNTLSKGVAIVQNIQQKGRATNAKSIATIQSTLNVFQTRGNTTLALRYEEALDAASEVKSIAADLTTQGVNITKDMGQKTVKLTTEAAKTVTETVGEGLHKVKDAAAETFKAGREVAQKGGERVSTATGAKAAAGGKGVSATTAAAAESGVISDTMAHFKKGEKEAAQEMAKEE